MATKTKIKIIDDSIKRAEIDELYELSNQITLAKWSLSLAKHTLHLAQINYTIIDEIEEGFHTNEKWQSGKACIKDVRKSGFKIHKLARETDNDIKKNVFRVVGHAVATGHMREHAMVASDYAIKVIGILTSNDKSEISIEREWQLTELKKIINSNNIQF